MAFSEEEIERYARHLVLAEVGGPGQQKLQAARVLVVGAGGLGAPVIQYLAAAGVGTIGIVDDDAVSLSNLQRQVIHDTAAVGRAKVESARDTVARINPHVAVETHALRLTAGNAVDLVAGYDIVADGSDNFDTRYAVSDACFHAGRDAGDRRGRPLRRVADDAEAARARTRRQAEPDLSLHLSRAAAGGPVAELRRGRRARRAHRGGRLDAGA